MYLRGRYEVQIEDFAKEQIYNTLIKSSVYTTKAEGKLKYERDNNKVDFDYVALAFSTVSDDQVKVTDEEIMAYMKKNPKKFKSDNTRSVEYVLVENKPSAADEAVMKTKMDGFVNGKVEFKGPDPQRNLIVQTGMAGMKMINQAIKKEAFGTGLTVNMDQSGVGAISGNNAMDLNFGFAFTSYTIPFLANVKFVLNPAFDNVHTNDIENPIIDGFPLSSYNFIVFDITDNTNDNIYLLKLKWDSELKWFYQNGTMDYMGRSQGFASVGNFNGYRVFMTQMMPSIWVKDPTKVLKIVMRNPITGGSF